MVKILVMTHGDLAASVCQAAQMICGKQEGLESLSFRPDWSLEKLVGELRAKLEAMGGDDPVLVMVDMFGGSPSNAIATLMGEGADIAAAAGVNLPMLLEALMGRDDADDVDAFAESVCAAARESVLDIGALLSED